MSCGKGTLTKTTTRAVLLVTVGLLGPPSTGISWRPTPGTLPGRVGQGRLEHSGSPVSEGKHMGVHPIYVISAQAGIQKEAEARGRWRAPSCCWQSFGLGTGRADSVSGAASKP